MKGVLNDKGFETGNCRPIALNDRLCFAATNSLCSQLCFNEWLEPRSEVATAFRRVINQTREVVPSVTAAFQ